ncbi:MULTISPECIES: MMPL family transporter [unclassified Streptomyces]|uniref:MMPL family transporter n=1 Tax=Streptomyces TaxID=1883 RepID=UPI0001C194C3|nr:MULTISPECIES: MMPL family transporter [unclassified Streptomyces]MYR70052.1 MMPL family transporter [Streptomyces sp. SID4939]MYS03063.1 MMPL family transporter [Streptomyces sp. SID4940]MYT62298.1 MMPL family transporter [Streptomyces sp. SID8357]MYT83906.1 MMPL family transporter [Streptomyces sp. SID8360]MYW37985.1 MMPL family transporter [Streptomyces sp. SID1]MYX77282.1 MMPL family transporter [Streptomyces sp. SID3915]
MATFLYKVGRLAFRRRWYVALVWVALLGLAGFGAASASTATSSSFSIPGTEAQKAFDLLEERFPGGSADGATARVVFKAPEGEKMTDADNRADVRKIVGTLESGSDQIASVADPYTANAVSEDGSTAYISVSYKVNSMELTDATRDSLEHAGEAARSDGLTVEIGGDALQVMPETGVTEVIGVAIAAVVLVITFGSLIAAGLPLLTALIGVGIGVSLITALANVLDLGSTTSTLAMMIGLAVGIDYALFIVSRYRAELAEGREREEAAGRAVGTAGSAVVFAGLTVVIALVGLAVVNIPMLSKMGFAAAGTVAIAVLIALTLVPALLGVAGKQVMGRKARKAADAENKPDAKPNMGTRWARFVLRKPVWVLLAGVVGLGVIAVPAASLEMGLPDDGSQPRSTTQRQAYDLLSDGFGPGFNGPLLVVVDTRNSSDGKTAVAQVSQGIEASGHVAAVTPATFNKAGDAATITVIPKDRPSSTDTENVVHAIRDAGADIKSETGAEVLVTGATAMNIDFSEKMNDALLPYLALVVGLAFLLLMVVFRSLLVPLKAALGFLLSVVAALGAVVAVFQWGWLASLFGVEQTGPIMSMMPIFMVGVVFGLAMDYEVFLVTRMREAYVHGETPGQAIVTGFRHGARVVTAAAVIMMAVFAGFIGSSESMIKMIGFSLAIAVFFDAFVVRMAIVPAVLALLGRRAWWLPRWLDRALPSVDVEGEGLRTEPAADGPGEGPGGERELSRV